METKQALENGVSVSPKLLIGIYEALRQLVATQVEKGNALAIAYLTSEDYADRNEALARLEMAEELQKLIGHLTPVINDIATQDLPRS